MFQCSMFKYIRSKNVNNLCEDFDFNKTNFFVLQQQSHVWIAVSILLTIVDSRGKFIILIEKHV